MPEAAAPAAGSEAEGDRRAVQHAGHAVSADTLVRRELLLDVDSSGQRRVLAETVPVAGVHAALNDWPCGHEGHARLAAEGERPSPAAAGEPGRGGLRTGASSLHGCT